MTLLRIVLGVASLSACFACTSAAQESPTGPLAVKLAGVTFKHFAQAPGYSEGPTWRQGEVFFCSGALLRVTSDGRVGRYLSLNPAGTVLRADGSLLICDNKHKALLELTTGGKLNLLAESCDGEKLKSLNDLTIDARGNVYWSDPEGSSLAKPVGSVLRLTPSGIVSRVATGLAFPNGLDVDPASKFLYVIESQSKKILRYALPASDDQPLGERTEFYDLGGSGGDGCAFDAEGNLWGADFHRPDTKQGRITVLDPQARVLAHLPIPAQVVSNIAFGGPQHNEIFCTTGTPAGVFHAAVNVPGFRGHPGVSSKVLRELPIDPLDEASTVTPRKFGVPGGIGVTRGWYIWRKWDPATWEAEVSKDTPDGETYQVRVLPWVTTYRQLAYGVRPDELLIGERVNMFFNPDERHSRGYLVHFQDEMCQMKGHGHFWKIISANAKSRSFTARAMAGDKPLEPEPRKFALAEKVACWRNGELTSNTALQPGEHVYLRWCVEGNDRRVHLLSDDASLDKLKSLATEKATADIAQAGLAGVIENVAATRVNFLAFSNYWAQAGQLKAGQIIKLTRTGAGYQPTGETVSGKLLSQKNLGTYGSGVNEMVVELADEKTAATIAKWPQTDVVRLIPSP